MLKNRIYKYFSKEIIKTFLTVLFAFTAIAWTVRAVNFLDLIVENGFSVKTYLLYSFLNISNIMTKFIPLTFLLALTLSIVKFEKQNEFLILWTSGLKKIKLINLFFLLSIFILILQLLFAVFITPFFLEKSRKLIRTSSVDALSAIVKTNDFSDSFKSTTFFIEKKDSNNEMQNVLEDSGASTVEISDVFSTAAEASEMPIVDSIDTWNKFYKTETKIVNGNAVQMTQEEIKIQKDKATKRLKNGNYDIPSEAKSSIDIATNIFAGQNGISKEQLTKLLSDIGQIESQYNTKIQYKGGPARSYWQVEAASAIDTLEQNAASNNPIFGKDFEKQFAYLIKGKSSTKVLKYLSSLSNSKMQKLLLDNSDLAATIALGIVLNRQ